MNQQGQGPMEPFRTRTENARTPTNYDMMQNLGQEISDLKLSLKSSEEARMIERQEAERMRKQERMEAERIRKQELQQLSDELFQRFKVTNPQPPVGFNQETGEPDPNMFPGENQDRLSGNAADRDDQERAKQVSALEYYNAQLKESQSKDRESVVHSLRKQREEILA